MVERVFHPQCKGSVCLFVYKNFIQPRPLLEPRSIQNLWALSLTKLQVSRIFPESPQQSGFTMWFAAKSVLCELHSFQYKVCSVRNAACIVQLNVHFLVWWNYFLFTEFQHKIENKCCLHFCSQFLTLSDRGEFLTALKHSFCAGVFGAQLAGASIESKL